MPTGTGLPSNLFAGGAVTFSSQPSVNLYAQQLAKRQAKQEAFDEYLRNLTTKINPTGMRTQDNEAFKNKYEEWVRFGKENRARLMKGDIDAQTQLNTGYQGLLNMVNESKQEEELKKPLVEILTDPNKRPLLSSNVIPAIASHDEPLYIKDANGNYVRNYNRKRLDYTSNLFNPQLDFDKEFTGWSKGMERGKTYGKTLSEDPTTGQVVIETQEKFSPDQITQIGKNAAQDVATNQKSLDYFTHLFETIDEPTLNKYAKIYESKFGRKTTLPNGMIVPTDVMDSPEKLAAARAIEQAQSMIKTGEERQLNRELANQRSINKIYLNREGFGGQQPSGNAFDDFSDNEFKNFKITGGTFYNKDGTPKNGEVFITGDILPASIKSALKAGGIEPKYFVGGVNAVVKDGQIESISNKLIGTITRQAMEGVYQPKMDTERKGEHLRFGEGKQTPTPKSSGKFPLPKGKPRTVSQGGYTYTWDENTGTYK